MMPVPTEVTCTPRMWGSSLARTHTLRYTPTICFAATYCAGNGCDTSGLRINPHQQRVLRARRRHRRRDCTANPSTAMVYVHMLSIYECGMHQRIVLPELV